MHVAGGMPASFLLLSFEGKLSYGPFWSQTHCDVFCRGAALELVKADAEIQGDACTPLRGTGVPRREGLGRDHRNEP